MLPSMFALSLAAQFSLYPTLLLPPMIMMLYQNQNQSKSLSVSNTSYLPSGIIWTGLSQSTIIDAVLAFVGHFFVSTYACSAFLGSKTLLRFYETMCVRCPFFPIRWLIRLVFCTDWSYRIWRPTSVYAGISLSKCLITFDLFSSPSSNCTLYPMSLQYASNSSEYKVYDGIELIWN